MPHSVAIPFTFEYYYILRVNIMVLAIVGSRKFENFELLKNVVDIICTKNDITKIISGCASGADKLAEKYALENNILFEKFSAEWKKYQLAAGKIRNTVIAENCDILIAFWDGKSKGTLDTIKKAQKLNKIVKIIEIIPLSPC
jgi:hypothetical protein